MLYINNDEHNIKQLLQKPAIIEKYQSTIPQGKEALQSLKPLEPVSEVIKQYIKEQFNTSSTKN